MRITFIHAHPDDETLATGALIAWLVASGHEVSLLTATRGERGEVVPGPLSHLADTQKLEAHRERELAGSRVTVSWAMRRVPAAGTATQGCAGSGRGWRDPLRTWNLERCAQQTPVT